MCDGEDMHEAEVAADVDDIWHSSFVALPKFECTPAMKASVDVNGDRRQTERKTID